MAEQLTEANLPNWVDWVVNFDKTRKVWLDSWLALKAQKPWVERNAPHLLAEHNRVMQKFLDQVPQIKAMERFRNNLFQGFAMIGDAAQKLLNAAGSGFAYVGGAIGDGFNSVKKAVGLGGLGFAQVVWLGVSLASALALLAAMAAVANDGFKQKARVDAYKLAIDRGASPEQAAAAVNAALGQPNDGQFLGLPIREALFAAVMLVLGPPIVRAITERRK